MAYLSSGNIWFIDNTSACNIISIIDSFTNKTHNYRFPEDRKSKMIFFYKLNIFILTTSKNTHDVTTILILRVFIFWFNSFLKDTLSNYLKSQTDFHSYVPSLFYEELMDF